MKRKYIKKEINLGFTSFENVIIEMDKFKMEHPEGSDFKFDTEIEYEYGYDEDCRITDAEAVTSLICWVPKN